MRVLVTGAAGFIGYHVAMALVSLGHSVVGVDNLNGYYDVSLKRARLAELAPFPDFRFAQQDIADESALQALFAAEYFTHVIHLAAQAGVRYSLQNPQAYIQSNLMGFGNILECCRQHAIEHLVYASSSSVYGLNAHMPFSVQDSVDHPVSLYAATKKSNELMAHSYSHLYQLPTTGLRFFTVYGPWGRPDMALFLFTKAILEGKPIQVFNNGQMQRDFTFIDDIVDGVLAVTEQTAVADIHWDPARPDPASSPAPYRIYNIGNNKTVFLEHFIAVLEESLGKKAIKNMLPMQPGDVQATYANIDAIQAAVGFTPTVSIEEGIPRFVAWYRQFYSV